MRFMLKQSGCGSDRVGNLSGFAQSSSASIDTPRAGILTQGGSVVHVTADVLSKVFKTCQLIWVPLSNSYHLEAGVKAQGQGVAKFVALPEHVTCATLHNMNDITPCGHFELDKVPLWTKNGKKMITADRYMDLMELFKPDIVIAIADGRTTLNESFKRIKKAVERSCNMLDICVKRYKESKQLRNSSLVGVIVGAANLRKCEGCIKHLLPYKDNLTGVALAGLTDGTADSLKVSLDELDEIFKKIGAALPANLVRIVEGCWNPAVVMTAIQHGWDVFDGTYPVSLTNAGLALTLNFDIKQSYTEACILDLNDEKYKDDFNPVLANCECLSCKKHTRAYIRHLLNTREMLASVLLSIHNLHHFDQMFYHARLHIAAKTFQIYKNHITAQYESYAATATTEEKPIKIMEIYEKSPAKKKICIDNNVNMDIGNGHELYTKDEVTNGMETEISKTVKAKKNCLENTVIANGPNTSTLNKVTNGIGIHSTSQAKKVCFESIAENMECS